MERTLAIFGISGRTGQAIARVAASEGWHVRGLLRAKSDVPACLDGVDLVRGSFSDGEVVTATVAGATAVCCVVGPRPPYREPFCAEATDAIIVAMKSSACRRLLCQTGAMIGEAENRSTIMEWMARSFARQRPAVAMDRAEQERRVEASDLEWTIVKPPRLTDGIRRDRVHAGPRIKIGLFSKISRADLAAFMFAELEAGRFVGQRVFVKG